MKLVKWLDKHLEEILLVALLFVMMIIMGIQILARYALGNSLSTGRRRSPGSVLSFISKKTPSSVHKLNS